jgi:hypothetical protein
MAGQASQFVERLGAVVWNGPVVAAARASFGSQGDFSSQDGFSFVVDGVRVTVHTHGPLVRLECALGPGLPREERAAREILAAFLPHTDDGPEVLCADASGQVLLIADVEPEGDAEPVITRFADAAVHWTRRLVAATDASTFRPMPSGPMFIFP